MTPEIEPFFDPTTFTVTCVVCDEPGRGAAPTGGKRGALSEDSGERVV